ncbi:SDR family NAD(P)-dependent oxidoreductase, partial [Pseudomonas fragi]|nr:SDR family NAD(P)-dependent oxidoreductase [Pseudomonas sp. GC01]
MPKASVLIAGCGDVGSRLAAQLPANNWQVYGLRRSIERLPAGVTGVAGDLFS